MQTFSIFAKFWEAGKVKTRLAKTIGSEAAAAIYRLCVQASIELGANWKSKEPAGRESVIAYSPWGKRTDFQVLAPDWQLVPQAESDLGGRMKAFFESQFNKQRSVIDQSVVLIGSDTPLLSAETVEEAFQHLESNDVVLGPSVDGGYYLIGLRNSVPDIFRDITWSTEKVLAQTLEQIHKLNLKHHLLPEHRDLDDLKDLYWLIDSIQDISDRSQTIDRLLAVAANRLEAINRQER